MTTPRVVELPRRLEPTSADTFLGAERAEEPPLAEVIVLRPRAARRPRRGEPVLTLVGPGDSAA